MSTKIPLVALMLALLSTVRVEAAVVITPAAGGSSMSANTAANGGSPAWTTLGPITIAEGAKQDFGNKVSGVTLVLKTPAGFEFNTALTPSVSFTPLSDVTAASAVISDSNTLTITYSTSAQKFVDTLVVGATGLQVRPTQAGPVAHGRHIYCPTTGGGTSAMIGVTNSADGSDGSNFGALTEVAATFAKLQLLLPGETSAPGTVSGKSGAPAAQTAGTAFNLTINAVDTYWNIATPIIDSVTFASSDSNATLPPATLLVSGTKTLPCTLKTAGTQTITASDLTDITKLPVSSSPVVLNPGPASTLVMGVQPSPLVQAGAVLAQQPVVLIEDAFNNVRSNDSRTITAAASSGPGTLLGTTSIAAVKGVVTFSDLAPTAALNISLRFTSGALTAANSSSIQVGAGPFSRLLVMLPGQTNAPGTAAGRGGTAFATAGTNTQVRVIATDAYFNPSGGITDMVSVATSDTSAVPPSSAALANGSNVFNLAFRVAASQTVTATDLTDGSKTSNTDTVLVSAGPFVKLQLLLPGETAAPATPTGKTGTPTATVAGTSLPITVNGVDANWNIEPAANGTGSTIQISSSDPNAVLPTNAALASGTHLFNITLRTAGNSTVTATDVDDASKTTSSSPSVTVNAGSFATLQVLLPGESALPGSSLGKSGTPLAQTAGNPFNVTVNSVDAYWNLLTTNDVVHVASSDTNAVLPADTALSSGSKSLAVTLKTAGTQTVTASDITRLAVGTNTSSPLILNPGAFSRLQLLTPGEQAAPGTASGKTGLPFIQTSGVAFNVTVNGVDSSWNVVNTNDTIRITSSDPTAVLPVNAALAAGSRSFSVTLVSIGNNVTVTASNVTHAAIVPNTSPLLTVAAPATNAPAAPIIAIHDSELTRALETMTAAATTPTGPGTTGKEWWPTNWHYFVMPESLKEAFRSDGTAFQIVSDADISAGKLLNSSGQPRYPILISLASEAIADTEIGPLTNYVAAGGFLFVGSSAFTRNPDGTTRHDFAFANQMGVHSLTPGLTNWRANATFAKQTDHRLVSHIPSGQSLYWEMPSGGDEISWGVYPHPGNPYPPNAIWQVQSSNATVIIGGDASPCLVDKTYGSGHFIYDAAMQPLVGHGGWAPGMYSYLIVRKAVEWAFESARLPIAKLSPWPYQYNAALMSRHDLEDYQNEIAGIEASAQIEYTNGLKGEYYFCTGTLREEMYTSYDTNAVIASLRRAGSNYNAIISSHNGGLRNPFNNPPLVVTNYDYWHWGPDDALDVTFTNYPSGKAYAMASVSNSFLDIERWLPGLASPNMRVWVAPYFNATREASYDIESQLGIKVAGEQKLTPFPSWTLSTATSGKRYPFLSLPVSDWYVGNTVAQSLEAGHNNSTVHALVDFYYGIGALINLYTHTLSTGVGASGSVATEYVLYSANTNLHPRVWPANAIDLYRWWLSRSNAQISVAYNTTNSETAVTTISISGASNTNTAIELYMPSAAPFATLQVFANGLAANLNTYRTNNQALKILVGTTVTNVQVRYSLGPQAQNDIYTFANGPALNIAAPGVLANDFAGVGGTNLSATLLTGPTNGTLNFNANGSFSYTPAAGFGGVDTFTYRVSDGVATSAPALVALTNANPPTFGDDFTRATDPGPVAPWIIQGGNWTVTGGQLQGGPSTLQSYGYIYLNRNWADYAVSAQIRFPTGAFGGGLGGRLDPTSGQHYGVWIYPENSSGGSRILNLIKFQNWTTWSSIAQTNLSAVGTNWHSVRLMFKGSQIAVDFDGTRSLAYSDAAPFSSGGVSLDMWTDSSAYAMNVDNVTVSPLVTDNTYTTLQNVALNVPAPGVLTNDTGPFGAGLSANALTQPAHGTLALNTNGGFVYTPANNYFGSDAFIYQASDGANALGSAWVNLTVTPTGVSTNGTPPVIQSVRVDSSGALITWTALTGRTYRLQYKALLTDSTWSNSTSAVVYNGSSASARDAATGAARRFYRVVLLP
jgi:hypothetical protein